MTVKELIQHLQQLDPDLRVFTAGYEGGYEDATISRVRDFELNYHTEWYYGPHELVVDENTNKQTVKGIIL